MKNNKKIIEVAKSQKIEEANIEGNNDLRNKIIIAVIGIVVLVLICFGIKYALNNSEKTLDGAKFKEEYERLNGTEVEGTELKYFEVSIDDKSPIKYSNYEEIFDILDNGSGIIYFGFSECPYSRTITPVLLDAVNEAGVDMVYYFNNKEDRDELVVDKNKKVVVKKEGTDDYYKLLEKLGDFASDYDLEGAATDSKRLYFPTILVVKEGKIVSFHEGTLDSQENPFEEMSKEQKEELKEILVEKFEKLVVCDGVC